jgi:hypothetical protein
VEDIVALRVSRPVMALGRAVGLLQKDEGGPDTSPSSRHIIKRARERVYEWIAYQTGRQIADVHVRQLDEQSCRMVIELLQDVEYETIRNWAVKRDRRNKRLAKNDEA